ncbi:MAG: ROK family protein [Polyangiaceae bacterium]|nr:ROK family protein [Polyangiaceae bacterium]
MVHLLRDAGAHVVKSDGAALVLEVPVGPRAEPGTDETQSPLFRVLRALAVTVADLVARAAPPKDFGRPATEQVVIGVDLGGTKIEAIVARRTRTTDLPVLVRHRVSTPAHEGYEAIVQATCNLLSHVAKEAQVDLKTIPIGVGMPGGVTRRTGVVKNSNTVCLNDRPFRTDLQDRLGRPVAVDNDANCFTLAEALLGAASEHRDGVVFGVILGTGVGGGISFGGRVWSGAQGIAGEWGHTAVWPERETQCYCGRRGCVELYASGPAVEKLYTRLSGVHLKLSEIVLRRTSDPHAEAVIEDFLNTFGRGLANVIDVLDPSAVVLGGGVSNVDLLYTEGISRVAGYVFNDELTTPILRNALGDSAGVYGAALIAENGSK